MGVCVCGGGAGTARNPPFLFRGKIYRFGGTNIQARRPLWLMGGDVGWSESAHHFPCWSL